MTLKDYRFDNKFTLDPSIYLFTIGILVRLFTCNFTYVINPDGVVYINQAKVIYYGRWDLLSSSGLEYLANYPLLIAGAYGVFHDWLFAAKSVSFFFGSLTLVPFYLLFRRFFDKEISFLGTLVFALVPLFVDRSADVVRDPVYWFFLVTGIYFFILHMQKNTRFLLLLSSIAFLLATWARIEAFLFIILSALFLIVSAPKKFDRPLIFLSPLMILAVILGMNITILGVDINIINRAPEIIAKFTEPIRQYTFLREQLSLINETAVPDNSVLSFFLPKARNCIWLVAIGTLFNHFFEAFFYPFCILLMVGFKGSWAKIKQDSKLRYLCILITGACILLYVHLMQLWIMDVRFLAIVIIPSFIFLGFGIRTTFTFIENRFHLQKFTVFSMICLFILVFGLAKNLQYRKVDKIIFKDLGDHIASIEKDNPHYIPVMTSSHTREMAFYSNRNNESLILPRLINLNSLNKNSYGEFLQSAKKYEYFLWEENYWKRQPFKFMDQPFNKNFKPLQHGYHEDTGRMILFKILH